MIGRRSAVAPRRELTPRRLRAPRRRPSKAGSPLFREHPPRRGVAVAAVLSLVALVVTSGVLTIPSVHEVTVIAVDRGRVRVAGLGLSDLVDGSRVTLDSGAGRFAAVVRDRGAVPDTQATAVVLVLDDAEAPLPEPYATARIDLGPRSLARVFLDTW